jgi:hypothetical protein
MKDETYVFISDVKEKGSIGRSARHRKTHAGKGGRVRLPSDNLSKKELKKMSGECKSYRLNEPMAWKEFKAMPDDIKVTYIKLLRQKFNPPVTHISKMMGVTEACVRRELERLNLTDGKTRSGRMKWDKEGFWAWVHGVDQLPTPVPEEMPDRLYSLEEAEAFIEDDMPFDIVPVEEPDCVSTFVPMAQCTELEAQIAELRAENDYLKVRIDVLTKCNDELMEKQEIDCQVIEKLRLLCSEFEEKVKILEAKLEVVQLIFGGK